MAQTGRTDMGFAVFREDIRFEPLPEKAEQEGPAGAVWQISGGYALIAADGDVTSMYGIGYDEGQDVAADGDAMANIARISKGEPFIGTLSSVTLAVAHLPGGASNRAKITQTGGVPLLVVDGGGLCRIQGPAPGFSVGDTNARVIVRPDDSLIQAGGGA